MAAALARQYPTRTRTYRAPGVVPELDRVTSGGRAALLVLWFAVGLVLLIACANIANMLLARTADRYRELGIRMAIGGSRGRVVRQLVTENLLIGVAGAAIGVPIARVALAATMPLVGDVLPRGADVAVNGQVIAVAIGLALLTTVLVSVPLALRVGRLDFGGTLHAAPRGATEEHDRLRGSLVIVQVALGLVLLSGAVTLAAGLRHLTGRDLGLRPERLVSFSVSVPAVRYDSSERQIAFTGRLLDELRSMPGVVAVAGSMPLPLTGRQMQVSFNVPDRPAQPSARPSADMAIVTAGYFEAVGAPVITGRTFTDDDDARHPRVVVVNRAFAAKFFPGDTHVVGKAIVPGASSDLDPQDGTGTVRRIVGVVADVRQSALGSEPEPMYYLPYRQIAWMVPSIVVRLSGTPSGLDAQFRRAVAAVDPHVALHELRTFEAVLATGVSAPRFGALVLGGFAGLALLLVATGLYGVLMYAVLRRTREIGIRIALGASRGAIAALIGGWAARLVGIGVVLGIVGASAAGELIRRVFVDPGVSRILPLAAVTGIVLVTAVAAACLPAVRAASVEPTISLRAD